MMVFDPVDAVEIRRLLADEAARLDREIENRAEMEQRRALLKIRHRIVRAKKIFDAELEAA